jgi:hypothetical protein
VQAQEISMAARVSAAKSETRRREGEEGGRGGRERTKGEDGGGFDEGCGVDQVQCFGVDVA